MTMPVIDDAVLARAVVRSFARTPDARLRSVMTSLACHLHTWLGEVRPSAEEWREAIGFLTRAGRMSVGGRQEFVLLSDVFGASILIDQLNDHATAGATESTVLGPFYIEGAPVMCPGADIAGSALGEPLYVEVEVRAASGEPLAGATVEAWQADAEGLYDVQRADCDSPRLRARFASDPAGRVRFWSITPTPYPIPLDGPVGDLLAAAGRPAMRPAHLHFRIAHRGYVTLVTQLFVARDRHLDADPVFAVKPSLIAAFAAQPPGRAPDGRMLERPWRRLSYAFVMAPQA